MTFGNVGFNEVDVLGAGGLREPLRVGHHVMLETFTITKHVKVGRNRYPVQFQDLKSMTCMVENYLTMTIYMLKNHSMVDSLSGKPLYVMYLEFHNKE